MPTVSPLPASLPPAGVVIENRSGQVVGTDPTFLPDTVAVNAGANGTASTTITPSSKPVSVSTLAADSGGGSTGTVALGVFDQSYDHSQSFGQTLGQLGTVAAGAVGGFLAGGPVGAVAGFAVAGDKAAGDTSGAGGLNVIAGIAGAVAGKDDGTVFGGGSNNDTSQFTALGNNALGGAGLTAPDISTAVTVGTVAQAISTGNMPALIKAGGSIPDFGTGLGIPTDALPDLSFLSDTGIPVDLSNVSDVLAFFNSNPTTQDLEAFQTALAGKKSPANPNHSTASTQVSNTTAAAAPAKGFNPAVIAGILWEIAK